MLQARPTGTAREEVPVFVRRPGALPQLAPENDVADERVGIGDGCLRGGPVAGGADRQRRGDALAVGLGLPEIERSGGNGGEGQDGGEKRGDQGRRNADARDGRAG